MITNGVVTIEDGNPGEPNDFNPRRKVKVELGFSVPEGADHHEILNYTAAFASSKVNELLGRKPAKEPAKTETVVAETPAKPTTKPNKKPAKEAATDKDKLAEAAGLPTADVVSKAPVDNVNVVSKAPVDNVNVVAAEPEADSLDDLLGDQAPVPITDAELAKAAQNKMQHMKAKDPNFSVKIRALVVEYAGQPPKKITDVPVQKRQEFLDKLRDLT